MHRILILILLTSPALADAPAWRGSSVSYRNAVSTLSFDEAAEPDFNPFYEMSLSVAPRWYFTEQIYARAGITAAGEITDSDWTTESAYLSDTSVAAGMGKIFAIPVLDTAFGAELAAKFPTSQSSQARTLIMALEPSVRVTQPFKLLAGGSIGYRFGAARDLHEFSTGELDQPRVPCAGSTDCLALSGNGRRNTTWRLSHGVSAGLGFTSWFNIGASFGVHTHYLHDTSEIEGVTNQAIDDTDTRHYFSYGVSAGFKPFDALGVGVGASTFNPQRAPNNDLHDPFFNRHTQVFVDLSLDVAALTSGDDS